MEKEKFCKQCKKPFEAVRNKTYCDSKCAQRWWREHNADVRKWHKLQPRKESTRTWLNELKNQPCKDCNGTFHPCCMDYDHINSETKLLPVGEMVVRGWSRENILEEIAKCELVCANCHRLRTWNRHQAKREIPEPERPSTNFEKNSRRGLGLRKPWKQKPKSAKTESEENERSKP